MFLTRETLQVSIVNPLKSVHSNFLGRAGPIFNIPSVVLASKALPSGVCATMRFWPSAAVSQFYGILSAFLQVNHIHGSYSLWDEDLVPGKSLMTS